MIGLLGAFFPSDENRLLAKLDHAMALILQAETIVGLIKKATRKARIKRATVERMLEQALAQDLVSEEDAVLVSEAEAVREDTIQVDAFTPAEYAVGAVDPGELDINIEQLEDPDEAI